MKKNSRVFITGVKGQLGSRVRARMIAAGHQVIADRVPLERDADLLYKVIDVMRPDYLINCAAMTDVDLCEDAFVFKRALHVNGEAVAAMSQAMRKNGGVFVHFSTDMIFGGYELPPPPWTEESQPNPVNKYGLTKYAAEAAIARLQGGHNLIIRVQNLFSSDRGCVVDMISNIHRHELQSIRVVSERMMKPTSARLVARDMMTLLENGWTGTFHLGPVDALTSDDMAALTLRAFNLEDRVRIEPIPFNDWFDSTRARRHPRSMLAVQKVLTACREIPERTCDEHFQDIVNEIKEDQNVRLHP